MGVFDKNQAILNIYHLSIANLIPAMVFLLLMQFDLKEMFSKGIGCACTIGAKKYWLLIFLSLVVSLFSQIVAIKLAPTNHTIVSIAIASTLGILSSFTPLKKLNGSQEVAITMLYMVVALMGSN